MTETTKKTTAKKTTATAKKTETAKTTETVKKTLSKTAYTMTLYDEIAKKIKSYKYAQFENDNTARNKENRATLEDDNAIIVCYVNNDEKIAKRIFECWPLKSEKNRFFMSKRIYEAIIQSDKSFKTYDKYFDEKKVAKYKKPVYLIAHNDSLVFIDKMLKAFFATNNK